MRWKGRGQKQTWLQEEIRRSILQGQKRWPMRDKEKRIAVMMSRPLGGHGHQSLPPKVHTSFSRISTTLILFRDGNIPSSKPLHKQPQFCDCKSQWQLQPVNYGQQHFGLENLASCSSAKAEQEGTPCLRRQQVDLPRYLEIGPTSESRFRKHQLKGAKQSTDDLGILRSLKIYSRHQKGGLWKVPLFSRG